MKQPDYGMAHPARASRPARGAWIETLEVRGSDSDEFVAPRAGRVD